MGQKECADARPSPLPPQLWLARLRTPTTQLVGGAPAQELPCQLHADPRGPGHRTERAWREPGQEQDVGI